MSVAADRLKSAGTSPPSDPATYDLTRELGPFEHILWATDSVEPHHFLLVVRLEGCPLDEHRLLAALAGAQRRHPALRVRIACADGSPPRYVPVNGPVPLRVIQGCHEDDWRAVSVQELAEPVDAGRGPLLRASLLLGENASHLILTVHHALGDGASAAYLMRDILEFDADDSHVELPARPSLEEIVTHAPNWPRSHETRLSPLRMQGQTLPAITTFEIAPQALDALVRKCRRERTTLHGAVIAAALLSFEGASPCCLSPIDVRRVLPDIVDDFGLYVAAAVTPVNVGQDTGFWQLARAARTQVIQAQTPTSLHGRVAAMRSILSNSESDAELYASYDALKRKLAYRAVLSNLGRLPGVASLAGKRNISAAYLLLNRDTVPTVGLVTVAGRLSVTMTSTGGDADALWFERFERLFRAAAASES